MVTKTKATSKTMEFTKIRLIKESLNNSNQFQLLLLCLFQWWDQCHFLLITSFLSKVIQWWWTNKCHFPLTNGECQWTKCLVHLNSFKVTCKSWMHHLCPKLLLPTLARSKPSTTLLVSKIALMLRRESWLEILSTTILRRWLERTKLQNFVEWSLTCQMLNSMRLWLP